MQNNQGPNKNNQARIVVGVPSYNGDISHHTMLAILRASQIPGVLHGWNIEISSLLTFNLNKILVRALAMRDQGLITHLAILHTDIEVEEHWLDKLLFLMKINKADIVGTVLPIKGEKNMTSTALWDGPFKVKRLTFDDCKKYGESFTDPALCVNTGAMLIDLRGKWIEGMCFTIEDRIRAEQGKYIAEVIPEDWGFSHRAAERGAKIVATTVVQAVHHGAGQWTNFEKGKKPIPLQTA